MFVLLSFLLFAAERGAGGGAVGWLPGDVMRLAGAKSMRDADSCV